MSFDFSLLDTLLHFPNKFYLKSQEKFVSFLSSIPIDQQDVYRLISVDPVQC